VHAVGDVHETSKRLPPMLGSFAAVQLVPFHCSITPRPTAAQKVSEGHETAFRPAATSGGLA
jgi:hypothetical protein